MCIRKKVFAGFLCILTSASLLAGCGSSDSAAPKQVAPSEESTGSGTEEQTAGETEAADDTKEGDNTNEIEKKNAEGNAESTGAEDEKKGGNKAVSIEEQVLYDQDGLKITAKEYTSDDIWGDGIKVLIENDTDQDIMLSCDALIVNDYMIHDLFASEIAAGKKANETIYLSSSELKAAGIDTVGRIEIYFHGSDTATFDTLFEKEHAVIETSAVDEMDTKANDDGMELYNEDGIRIVGKTVDENSFWGAAILLYIENDSGHDVGISVDDMSINGFMMTPYFSTQVYDGKKSLDDITLLSSELEENGIEAVEEVELKFHIYDLDSYETIADSDPITFTAK